ncbi:MAG: hypothetical protein ACPGO5_00795 [Patescibacteria group bacterium]
MRRENIYLYVVVYGIFLLLPNTTLARVCTPTIVRETCISDTTKQILYTYKNSGCGDAFTKIKKDNICSLQVNIPIVGNLCHKQKLMCYEATASLQDSVIILHGHDLKETFVSNTIQESHISQQNSSTTLHFYPATRRVFIELNDFLFFGTMHADFITHYLKQLL